MTKPTPLMLAALAALAVPQLAAAQTAPAQPAAASQGCEFTINTSPEVREQLETLGLDFPGYDALCAAVRGADAGAAVDVTHGVTNGHSFVLAEVKFFDLLTRTSGWMTLESTKLSPDTAPGVALAMVPEVVSSAMQAISEDPSLFLASIDEERNRFYSVALGPVPEPAAPAENCTITFAASPEFMATINAWGDVSFGNEAMCRRLEAAGAGVRVFEENGTLGGQQFAWVRLGLFDIATDVNSPMRVTSMSLSADAGEAALAQIQRTSLDYAIDGVAQREDRMFENLAAETAATRDAVTRYPDLFRY